MKNTSRFASLYGPVLFVVLLLLSGCSRSASRESAPSSAAAAPAAGEVSPLVPPDRSLVVTVDVSLTVERVTDASARLREAALEAGGFVSDMTSSGDADERTAHLELRVPADKVTRIRTALETMGQIDSVTERVEDVTEQHADIEARLRSARTQEKRLLELMEGKTTSIRDLVEMEKELARVRENVERLEAQERVMKSRIQLATVRVELSRRNAPAWQTPGASIVRAFGSGMQAARAIVVYGAMVIAAAGPLLAPIVAVLIAVALVVRRRRTSAAAVAHG